MEQFELQQLTDQLSREYFDKPYKHHVCFNKRLRTTGGRYIPARQTIEINPKYLQELGIEELVGILKHELCHYHLHIEGKPYNHRSKEFKELLQKTGSPRYCERLPSEKSKETYQYRCEKCGLTFNRKRRIQTSRYRCGKCKGKIVTIN
ncbi:SprT family protein [Alkalibacillus haloalkaliphilus]|uniref:SprT family protein n=1 Tax=Alkalibacillus haloalkaliphilus TaxID=94136 RepID=UPI0002E15212|nr:SprT family protein [Alkalibacillus haloalkaliphilus]